MEALMIHSMLPVVAGFLLIAACETAPKSADAGSSVAGNGEPVVAGDDEPAVSPRREPCGEGPATITQEAPPRQTGAPTSNGEPIE
jgi:hypothetical protein